MTEHTTYICDYCGEVFGNEDNCFRHEWEHRFELLKNRVKFMKEKNGVFIELPLAIESVDECTVIYCDGTDEAWDILDEAFDCRGCYCVPQNIRDKGHLFVYDCWVNDWFCFEKKLEYFIKLSTEINKNIKGK